jgi:hypothetical protein
LAGILYLVGLLLRGYPADDPRNPGFDPSNFAQAVTTMGYRIDWLLLILGTVLLIFGYKE